MSINDRISELIKVLNLNSRSFSSRIEADSTVMHNIVSGRKSEPKHSVIEKILLTFENINPNWLILGKGDMFITASLKMEEIEILRKEIEDLKTSNKELTALANKLVDQLKK